MRDTGVCTTEKTRVRFGTELKLSLDVGRGLKELQSGRLAHGWPEGLPIPGTGGSSPFLVTVPSSVVPLAQEAVPQLRRILQTSSRYSPSLGVLRVLAAVVFTTASLTIPCQVCELSAWSRSRLPALPCRQEAHVVSCIPPRRTVPHQSPVVGIREIEHGMGPGKFFDLRRWRLPRRAGYLVVSLPGAPYCPTVEKDLQFLHVGKRDGGLQVP